MNYTNNQKREMVKQDYDAIAEIYVKNCSETDFYKPYVDEFLKALKGKSLLDAGCGHGIFTDYFDKQGLDVVGVDFSKRLLSVAMQNYPTLKFIESDLCDFETKQKFDGVFVKNVLFHIPDNDLQKILKKFHKILCDDGKICILQEIPKEQGEQVLAEEFDETLKIYYNYMLPEKVEKLLIESGFNIAKSNIVKDNQNATIYAYGLMIIVATKIKG